VRDERPAVSNTINAVAVQAETVWDSEEHFNIVVPAKAGAHAA
jgi:hypothetical protein